MASQIQIRRDTAAAWTAANPTLAQGEMGIETDSVPAKWKIGDGLTAWNDLDYVINAQGGATTSNKIDDFAVSGTSDTTKDANTTNHGLLLKAVAPATGFMRFVGIAYGDTIYALKELFDTTVPSAPGTAAHGNSLYAAAANHVHSAELTLADGKSVQLKEALGSDHTCSGLTVSLTAHEATTLFQVGFINSDGEIALADADAEASMPVRAMATAGINADAAGVYLLRGYAHDESWNWTPGSPLYASGTPGALTQTAPTGTGKVVQVLGYAITAKIIHFTPDLCFITLS